jgi:biopolymer transport protein ExbB
MSHGFEEMRDAASSAAAAETAKLNQKISYLALLANIAPMLGLFGTVFGMVSAFGEIVALGPAVTPKDLAGGVQQALITTVDGLLVAMPCIAFQFWFKNKVIQISTELTAIGEDMLERFRTQGQAA